MDRLPVEIVHMVFAHLAPQDATQMRLICKSFSELGLHYILPRFHLIFKSTSFERLRRISTHPVLSQHVQTIFYEADTLQEFDDMEDWKENIIQHDFPDNIPDDIRHTTDPSERQVRAYRREMKRLSQGPRWTYTETQLSKAYGHYKMYLANQAMMRAHDYNAQLISDAMRRLPNLKSVVMAMELCFNTRSSYISRAFSASLQKPYGDRGQVESCGVPQLRSLLLGVWEAGLKLEDLRCGYVHWQFFRQSASVFAKVKEAVQHLQSMELHISTTSPNDDPDDEDAFHIGIPECIAYLKGGRLRDFVTAAPDLTALAIYFDWDNPQPPSRLVDIVGTFTWDSLRYASFSYIETTEDELMAFYTRHSSTLREIALDTIILSQGSWARTFQKMAKVLQLKEASVSGILQSLEDVRSYDLGSGLCEDEEIPFMKRVVDNYLIEGGDLPLIELDLLADAADADFVDTVNNDDSDDSSDSFDSMVLNHHHHYGPFYPNHR